MPHRVASQLNMPLVITFDQNKMMAISFVFWCQCWGVLCYAFLRSWVRLATPARTVRPVTQVNQARQVGRARGAWSSFVSHGILFGYKVGWDRARVVRWLILRFWPSPFFSYLATQRRIKLSQYKMKARLQIAFFCCTLCHNDDHKTTFVM